MLNYYLTEEYVPTCTNKSRIKRLFFTTMIDDLIQIWNFNSAFPKIELFPQE